LRITEAADYLGIGRSTLYELVKAGKLKPLKVAGTPRYRRIDLDKYVASLR
jgi:excisionase family DNA binding protein